MSRIEILKQLIQSACADGKISETEKQLLIRQATDADVSAEDLENMIFIELTRVNSQNKIQNDIKGQNSESGFITEVSNSQSGFITEVTISGPIQKESEFTEIVSLNTQGAMSFLQKAKQHGNRWVVVKRIKPEYRDDSAYLELFYKEYENAVHLEHPHIVRIYNKSEDENGPYYVMEFIDGRRLTEMIENKQLNESLSIKIIKQILDALTYVHKKQIYHRDLKPDNILITYKGDNAKLIDFGLAAADSFEDILKKAGTPKYAAPEQFKTDGVIDQRSDIYSIGLIFLEMLAGNTNLKSINSISNNGLAKIITKCSQPIPNNRYNSCEEVLADLNAPVLQKTIPEWLEKRIADYCSDGKITANEKKVLTLEATNNNIDLQVLNAFIELELEKTKEKIERIKNETKRRELEKKISEKKIDKKIKQHNKENKTSLFKPIFRIIVLIIIILAGIYGYKKFTPKISKSGATNLSAQIPVKYFMYVNSDGLNLRDKPDIDSKKIGAYKKGTKVNVYAERGVWMYVMIEGKYGYMSASYLKKHWTGKRLPCKI